jgi:nitrous oxidase accessory protein NosD
MKLSMRIAPALLLLVPIGVALRAEQHTATITLDARSDAVIRGVTVSTTDGPCILLRNGSRRVRIEDSQIGPCGGHGIHIAGGGEIVISGNYIHDTNGFGIAAEFASDVAVANNRIERSSTGVYISRSSRVSVERNNFLNMRGPHPAGAFIQFSEVRGGGNRIRCNTAENIPGQSNPEDAINIYASHGTQEDPIQVVGNRIRGGGPSLSGGGINLGDTGGSHIVASNNVLVNPGQYGIAVSGGNNITVQNNIVYARQQPFTNVGITAWRAYPGILCSGVAITGNVIDWRNASGEPSPVWTDGKCGSINWRTNHRNAIIDVSVFDSEVAACVEPNTAAP